MPFLYSVSPEYILNRRDDELFKHLMALFPKLTKEILIAVDTIRTSTLFSLHLPQNAELFLFIASVAPVTIEEHRLYATFSAGLEIPYSKPWPWKGRLALPLKPLFLETIVRIYPAQTDIMKNTQRKYVYHPRVYHSSDTAAPDSS